MPRTDREWLEGIAYSVQSITEFTTGISLAEYRQDKRTKAAVERHLIVIGEALSQLEQQSPDAAAGITGKREIIGMRIILTHRFYEVDDRIVWAAIFDDVPLLRTEVHKLLTQAEAVP